MTGSEFGPTTKLGWAFMSLLLADAASVQFTRNPDGIAGALDSIRYLRAGTTLRTAYAAELSHMFFAPAVVRWWAWPSHPPLEERIRRAIEAFDQADALGREPEPGRRHAASAPGGRMPILQGSLRPDTLASRGRLPGTRPLDPSDWLVTDEAHATLVFGKRGGGLSEALGLSGEVDLQAGTLSKAVGALGGFVAASAETRALLLNTARPYIFTTALPAPVVAAARAALRVAAADGGCSRSMAASARSCESPWATAASRSAWTAASTDALTSS